MSLQVACDLLEPDFRGEVRPAPRCWDPVVASYYLEEGHRGVLGRLVSGKSVSASEVGARELVDLGMARRMGPLHKAYCVITMLGFDTLIVADARTLLTQLLEFRDHGTPLRRKPIRRVERAVQWAVDRHYAKRSMTVCGPLAQPTNEVYFALTDKGKAWLERRSNKNMEEAEESS